MLCLDRPTTCQVGAVCDHEQPAGDDVESWPPCLWPDEWTRQWAIEEARLQRDLDSVL